MHPERTPEHDGYSEQNRNETTGNFTGPEHNTDYRDSHIQSGEQQQDFTHMNNSPYSIGTGYDADDDGDGNDTQEDSDTEGLGGHGNNARDDEANPCGWGLECENELCFCHHQSNPDHIEADVSPPTSTPEGSDLSDNMTTCGCMGSDEEEYHGEGLKNNSQWEHDQEFVEPTGRANAFDDGTKAISSEKRLQDAEERLDAILESSDDLDARINRLRFSSDSRGGSSRAQKATNN